VPPLQFILQQALLTHPLAAPIWLAGLFYLLFGRETKSFRFLGWAYVVVLGELLLLKGSKIYYLAPIYPVLLAAGAVWIERYIQTRNRPWLKPAIVVPLVIGAIVAAPLAMPVLPVEATARYSRFWNVEGIKVENHEIGRLPQLFADMFGWENQVGAVAGVFRSLPAADQAKCALFASNYGEAGAIDYFGPAYGLPQAISNHNSYYLWGPRNYSGEVVITLGFALDELRPLFGDIRLAATLNDPYALPDENNVQVYICRQPKISLQQAWPKLKLYN